MVKWNGEITNSARIRPKGHIFLIMHEDNNSDLTASLAYNFTEVKGPKLGIDIVVKLSFTSTIFTWLLYMYLLSILNLAL